MLIKLDMEKIYGRLDWNFIKKYFGELDFSDIWINWMWQCTTTLSLKLLLMVEEDIHFYQK